MRPYSLGEIACLASGRILGGSPGELVLGVSTDSRQIKVGDMFVAIRGERSDGHDFLAQAASKGATAALVEREDVPTPGTDFGIILVDSTAKALGALARSWREELPAVVVGVTGSVGKTSVKDFTFHVLEEGFRAYCSPGNLNSHIGLPLAVVGMDPSHEYAVLEMAMRGRGEIRDLCLLVRPKIGILTDVSPSHIGELGSIEEIALAKAELLLCLPDDGLAVVCGDNPYTKKAAVMARCRRVFYGFGDGNDVRAVDIESGGADGSAFTAVVGTQSFPVRITVPGRHQVLNALGAVAVGYHLGLPPSAIARGLGRAVLSPMRLQVTRLGRFTLIDDAYNASPKSMESALDLLGAIPGGRKIAVLGEMRELGSWAPVAHREVGAYAAGEADLLVAIGALGKEIKSGWKERKARGTAVWFSTKEEALPYLREVLGSGDVVLVKASRSLEFETVTGYLKTMGGPGS